MTKNNKSLTREETKRRLRAEDPYYGRRQGDELTPFRELARRARRRKQHECDITPAYLKEVWEKQEGRCVWTNVPLVLPLSSYKHDTSNPNVIASLDRIDNNKGYVKGNVQFVMTPLNYAKNNFSDEVVMNLVRLIRESA